VCETVPGTGEVARFPAETLGTHKDGNTEYSVTSTGSPTVTPPECVCVCGGGGDAWHHIPLVTHHWAISGHPDNFLSGVHAAYPERRQRQCLFSHACHLH
jgi:hypothetical protein